MNTLLVTRHRWTDGFFAIGKWIDAIMSAVLTGAICACAILVLWPASFVTGALGLLYLSAILATREVAWNFIILGADPCDIGQGIWATGLSFGMVYGLGLLLLT